MPAIADVDLPADVDVATAAKILNTSTRFVRRRIQDGHLKAHRLRGSRIIRIARADVESLKQDVGSTAGTLTPELRAQIKAAVDAWEPLTPEQRDSIATIFSLPDGGGD